MPSAEYSASLRSTNGTQLSRLFHGRHHESLMPGLVGSALTSSFENLAASGLGVLQDATQRVCRGGERNDGSAMSAGRSLRGPRRSSFVVRIDRDDEGKISGVIERVRTGEKETFRGLEAIGGVIARMVEADTGRPSDLPRGRRARRQP